MSFRETPAQDSLFTTLRLLPGNRQRQLENDWPGAFAQHILPLIDESKFSHFYHDRFGRPNKPVKLVVGVLVFKEMFNLTDEEALGRLTFDLRWHAALNLTPEEASMCQKTLHNFRTALSAEPELGQALFADVTDALCEKLGLDTSWQRMDSTQIMSNIARLKRMGLFCETIRTFLRRLRKKMPEAYERIPSSLINRYLKGDGKASRYEDAPRSELNRRLGVAARDVWRLVDRFRDDEKVRRTEIYKLLERLFAEQCEQTQEPVEPEDDDADAGEPPVAVQVKPAKEVGRDSLQSPADPDATYSARKGKGYEVQIGETFGNKSDEDPDKPEMVTHVAVSKVCGSDAAAVESALDDLEQRGQAPDEMVADTAYTGTQNVIDAQDRGTSLVGPVAGNPRLPAPEDVTVGDFEIDLEDPSQSTCPHGATPLQQRHDAEADRIELTFARRQCDACSLQKKCPTRRDRRSGDRTLKTNRHDLKLAQRKREQATVSFRERYANRAGIEATMSEGKRAHGLGRLRVRGRVAVCAAVLMKMLACNVKRAARYFARASAPPVCANGAAVVGGYAA